MMHLEIGHSINWYDTWRYCKYKQSLHTHTKNRTHIELGYAKTIHMCMFPCKMFQQLNNGWLKIRLNLLIFVLSTECIQRLVKYGQIKHVFPFLQIYLCVSLTVAGKQCPIFRWTRLYWEKYYLTVEWLLPHLSCFDLYSLFQLPHIISYKYNEFTNTIHILYTFFSRQNS